MKISYIHTVILAASLCASSACFAASIGVTTGSNPSGQGPAPGTTSLGTVSVPGIGGIHAATNSAGRIGVSGNVFGQSVSVGGGFGNTGGLVGRVGFGSGGTVNSVTVRAQP